MMTLPKATALTLAISGLAACGGGGGGDGGGNTNPIPEYVNFSNSSFAVDSELEGRILIAGTSAAEIRAMTGTLTHNTRALTGLTNGTNTLNDADGDDSGTWTDGTVTFQPSASQAGTYSFAAFYNFIAPTDSGIVVIGVSLDAADVPAVNTTGGVTYTGEAIVDGSTDPGGAGTSLSSTGNSTIVVNFETDTADLTINGVGGVPYSEITITGMTFGAGDRSAFSGGMMTIRDSGGNDITETLLGANVVSNAAGDFFGIDANDNPDEVGGVFEASGDGTGEIYGGFLAK